MIKNDRQKMIDLKKKPVYPKKVDKAMLAMQQRASK